MSPLPLFLLTALAAPQSGGAPSPWEALAEGETITVEQTLFILNEEVITFSMVEEEALRQMRLPKNAPKSTEEAMSRALAGLVFNLIALEGFRRLGLDETLLEEQVTQQMDFKIESFGSRARFEEVLLAEGLTLMAFRERLRADVVKAIWRSVVTGQQPSPLQGFRTRVDVTPAEIRAEFDQNPKRWEQGFSLVWEALQFHDNSQGSGLARAQSVADALRARTTTLAEAKSAAQSTQEHRGDPAERNLRPEIREFLLNGAVGEVSAVEPIPNLGGMIFVVVERNPARTIGFAEAQARISLELREQRAEALVVEAALHLIRTSYTWNPPSMDGFINSLFQQAPSPRETEF